jgi:hypothetical protein
MVHLFASFLLVIAVTACVTASAVARAYFFCASTTVVKPSDVLACTGHAAEDSAGVLFFCYPADVFVSFYGRCIWIKEDNFEPFVFAIFAYPVAVQNF